MQCKYGIRTVPILRIFEMKRQLYTKHFPFIYKLPDCSHRGIKYYLYDCSQIIQCNIQKSFRNRQVFSQGCSSMFI